MREIISEKVDRARHWRRHGLRTWIFIMADWHKSRAVFPSFHWKKPQSVCITRTADKRPNSFNTHCVPVGSSRAFKWCQGARAHTCFKGQTRREWNEIGFYKFHSMAHWRKIGRCRWGNGSERQRKASNRREGHQCTVRHTQIRKVRKQARNQWNHGPHQAPAPATIPPESFAGDLSRVRGEKGGFTDCPRVRWPPRWRYERFWSWRFTPRAFRVPVSRFV